MKVLEATMAAGRRPTCEAYETAIRALVDAEEYIPAADVSVPL